MCGDCHVATSLISKIEMCNIYLVYDVILTVQLGIDPLSRTWVCSWYGFSLSYGTLQSLTWKRWYTVSFLKAFD
eukprot:c37524_g1_i1 orf=2-223(+)